MKHIGLIDCNNFFVSCERLFRPDLLGRPVVVLSSNDGCVVSRSQEAKALNIPMGVPLFQIKDIVKDNNVALFSSNFPLYRDVSARVMTALKTLLGLMEQYSVDESFFEIDSSQATLDHLRFIKDTVERQVGIPVSIGVAATKTLAKIAAGEAKRSGGVFILSPREWEVMAEEFLLREIWGVGPGLSKRLSEHGMTRASHVISAEPRQLSTIFGVGGVRLKAELSGQSVFAVTPSRAQQKSIMSSRSFAKAIHSKAGITDAVAYHLNHALEDLRAMDAVAVHCSISVRASRFSDYAFSGIYEAITLAVPSADPRAYLKPILEVIDRQYDPEVPYKKAGITISGITAQSAVSGELFPSIDNSKVLATVDAINSRYGGGTIAFYGEREGATRTAKKFSSPRYTTSWSDIPTVGAK